MSWTAAIPLVGQLIDRIFPDKEARDKAKLELATLQQSGELERMVTAAGIVTAEIQGESWLQRNWRPLTMIWFSIMVGAHWFGMTPQNLSAEAIDNLFLLVQIGLGGYVVGRSTEKVMKEYKRRQ